MSIYEAAYSKLVERMKREVLPSQSSAPYILGISAYAHDSSAALIQGGKILAFAEEERFNREKHTLAFPLEAAKFCLASQGLGLPDIERMTYFWQPWREVVGNVGHMLQHFPESLNLITAPGGSGDFGFVSRHIKIWQAGQTMSAGFSEALRKRPYYCRHHMAHAASAFYGSSFDDSAILTLDGRGEDESSTYMRGQGTRIEPLHAFKLPHSIGHFYSAITAHLGFVPFKDEWKVMGLSAYGTKRFVESFRRLYRLDQNGFRLNLDYFSFHVRGTSRWLTDRFRSEFSPEGSSPETIFAYRADLAYAAQKVVEEAGLELARELRRRTGSKNLCVAGGVALNCLMNKRILEESGFSNVFFQPVANDAGASLGSALYYSHHILGQPRSEPLRHLFLGPEFSEMEITSVLASRGFQAKRWKDLTQVADLLWEGKVLGWFQGAMEAGPRALGHRSILADPGAPGMKDRINRIIKKRENFRPFAPATLRESAEKYFTLPKQVESPYMILVGEIREEWREKVPAVVHVDGTCRVQTVRSDVDPLFHGLIQAFGQLSGYEILLNTSFNENEPIVCRPEEAIDCFLRTPMDALVLGPFLLEKTNP